jgi:hypothetical protein
MVTLTRSYGEAGVAELKVAISEKTPHALLVRNYRTLRKKSPDIFDTKADPALFLYFLRTPWAIK